MIESNATIIPIPVLFIYFVTVVACPVESEIQHLVCEKNRPFPPFQC